jgi:hypothetical protein
MLKRAMKRPGATRGLEAVVSIEMKRLKRSETAAQKGKEMKILIQPMEAKRFETTTIIRGGSLDPVWPFRFSPFPRGQTLKRSRCLSGRWGMPVSCLDRLGAILPHGALPLFSGLSFWRGIRNDR